MGIAAGSFKFFGNSSGKEFTIGSVLEILFRLCPPAPKANPGLQDFLSRECPSNRHKNIQLSAPPPKTDFWFEPSGLEAMDVILEPGGWQSAPKLDGIEKNAEGINIWYDTIRFSLILDHAIPATMALLITKRPMVSDPCLLYAQPVTIMHQNGHLSLVFASRNFRFFFGTIFCVKIFFLFVNF